MKLSPAQIIDQVQEPLRKRLISGPMSNDSRGYYVIASVRTPADTSTALRLTTSEYDRRVIQAAAIVYAESGGNTDAVCYNVNDANGRPTCSPKPPAGPRGVDRGLWQWNSVAWPNIDDLAAFDPSASTEIAYTVSNAYSSFGPWSKSRGMDPTSPQYKTIADTYASTLGTVIDDTPVLSDIDPNADGMPDVIPSVFGTIMGWAEALGRLLSALISRDFWIRVGIGALGVVLVVFAVTSLSARTKLGAATTAALTKGK